MLFKLFYGAAPLFCANKVSRGAVKNALAALTIGLATTGLAQAATIDFTDGIFTPEGQSLLTTRPSMITETVADVTFTIMPNIGGDGPFSGFGVAIDEDGLRFDNFEDFTMTNISLSADKAVRLTSITGRAVPLFSVDYSAPGYGPFGIGYATVLSEVGLFGGGVELDPGEVFFVSTSATRTGDKGFITAIGFDPLDTPPVSEVPLPASGFLLFAGLTGMAAWRKRHAS